MPCALQCGTEFGQFVVEVSIRTSRWTPTHGEALCQLTTHVKPQAHLWMSVSKSSPGAVPVSCISDIGIAHRCWCLGPGQYGSPHTCRAIIAPYVRNTWLAEHVAFTPWCAAEQFDDFIAHLVNFCAVVGEHLGGDAFLFADQTEKEVLGPDVGVAE